MSIGAKNLVLKGKATGRGRQRRLLLSCKYCDDDVIKGRRRRGNRAPHRTGPQQRNKYRRPLFAWPLVMCQIALFVCYATHGIIRQGRKAGVSWRNFNFNNNYYLRKKNLRKEDRVRRKQIRMRESSDRQEEPRKCPVRDRSKI